MDLRCRLNQILKVGASEEVSEVHKFTMIFVFNIDDSPSVLTSTDLLATDND